MPIGKIYSPPQLNGRPTRNALPLQTSKEAIDQPRNYRGKLPWMVYLQLQNRFPQGLQETDLAWTRRILPVLQAERKTLMIRSTDEFKVAIRNAALNRGMRRIVGYDPKKHPGLEAQRLANNAKVIDTNPYKPGGPEPKVSFEDQMVQWLADMSDVSTPEDGSIFWNGVNENKLAERVTQWNREYPDGKVHFGQLEATTDVQYVNNKYLWIKNNAYHKYGEKVSEKLGVGATGHVTAVVRWGLNKWSIFTTTELPRMLYIMESQILKDGRPKMTDLSIIVIEPLGQLDRVKVYVNAEILKAPVWDSKPLPQGTYPASTEDCVKISDLGNYVATGGYCGAGKKVVPTSPEFMAYLKGRPRKDSPATARILKDADAIVHPNQPILRK